VKADTQSLGDLAIVSGRVPLNRSPPHACGVQITGSPSAAASSSLFLMPPPLTNGITATSCCRNSGRRSAASATTVIPSFPFNACTAGTGLKPKTENRASGAILRTTGHTDRLNHRIASILGPASSRPQKVQLFGVVDSVPG